MECVHTSSVIRTLMECVRTSSVSRPLVECVCTSSVGSTHQETLLALAKAVANATATLVLKAKGVAAKCDNQGDQNRVIGSATHAALATSQLVACTKVRVTAHQGHGHHTPRSGSG